MFLVVLEALFFFSGFQALVFASNKPKEVVQGPKCGEGNRTNPLLLTHRA